MSKFSLSLRLFLTFETQLRLSPKYLFHVYIWDMLLHCQLVSIMSHYRKAFYVVLVMIILGLIINYLVIQLLHFDNKGCNKDYCNPVLGGTNPQTARHPNPQLRQDYGNPFHVSNLSQIRRQVWDQIKNCFKTLWRQFWDNFFYNSHVESKLSNF